MGGDNYYLSSAPFLGDSCVSNRHPCLPVGFALRPSTFAEVVGSEFMCVAKIQEERNF